MEYRKKRVYARISSVVALTALVAMPATALARFGDKTLSTGSSGHDVRVLQSWLDKMGFHTGIDGSFGRHTRWALRRFEQTKRLQVNGVLSPDDARTMRSAMAARFSASGGEADLAPVSAPATRPGASAAMASDGLHAVAPADAPPEVQAAIAAANKIVGKPYKYGGGHGQWEDSGYDCSGLVSYALHGAGLLDQPMSSGEFAGWGVRGEGTWISVYGNSGHAYAVIAGLRLDTSGSGGRGPRWHSDQRSGDGYDVRHWQGL
jgi:peptidoglycan hydrolase-like protein with peptidoglycan-binding domain